MTAPLDIEGPAAPPRSNGELVFSEPWESRAFGMAVSLHEAGTFTWPEFQAALVARIGEWESASARHEPWNYYQLWLAALEDVLVGLRAVSADEVTARTQALGQRPRGHDHRDDHDHHTDAPPKTRTANLSGQVKAGDTGGMDDAVRRYRDEIASAYQAVFDRLHRLIVGTCPDAEVVLSYGMPTYRIGRRRLNVGVWKQGVSLYVSPSRDGGFSGRHPELAAGKGTIKLRPEDAARIPDEEFRDLVRAALHS